MARRVCRNSLSSSLTSLTTPAKLRPLKFTVESATFPPSHAEKNSQQKSCSSNTGQHGERTLSSKVCGTLAHHAGALPGFPRHARGLRPGFLQLDFGLNSGLLDGGPGSLPDFSDLLLSGLHLLLRPVLKLFRGRQATLHPSAPDHLKSVARLLHLARNPAQSAADGLRRFVQGGVGPGSCRRELSFRI